MLARLLVLANVALAVGLLAWALTLSANRLDWVDAKTDTGTVKGQVTLLNEEIDRAVKGAADLEATYAARTRALADADAFRTSRKVGYRDRLAKARGGQFQKPAPLPGNELFVDLTRAGEAEKTADGKPLRGTDAIQADIQKEIAAGQRALAGDAPFQLPMAAELETLLGNDADYEAAAGKLGSDDLRKLQAAITERVADSDRKIIKQKEIAINLRDEAGQLGGARGNWKAQLNDLLDRQSQLKARLAGLGGN